MPVGRRARKNAQTRAALAAAAEQLFLAKGYDQVSVKEIADAVDISVPTLFNHVPGGKEAIMFDDGVERREGLLAAVKQRPAGVSLMASIREYMLTRGPFVTDPAPDVQRRTALIMKTPALRNYTRTMWIRSEGPLAEAIAAEAGLAPGDITARAAARFILEIPEFVGDEPDPRAALNAIFELLENGFGSVWS